MILSLGQFTSGAEDCFPEDKSHIPQRACDPQKLRRPGIHPCHNVLLKGMSRKKCSPSAQCRSFFLGIQPTRLNVHSYFREWSSSAPRPYFVPACEAEKRCSPVVPFLLP